MTTAIATLPTTQPLPRRRWTDEEFDRLVATGIIREGSSTFLWDGEVIEPMVEDNPHFNAVDCLQDILKASLSAGSWSVRNNFPIQLAEGYRPQPDLIVLRGPRSSFRAKGRLPKPGEIALLVEVSSTTYSYDSGDLLANYAGAGITQYWIINISSRRIEVYTDPDMEVRSYRQRKDYGLDEAVPLSLVSEGVPYVFAMIRVREVLQDSLEDA